MLECTTCKHTYVTDDLLDGICFRCRYASKIKPKRENLCKMCKNNPVEKGYAYCSTDCRRQAKSIKIKQYWTKKITAPDLSW